MSLSTTSRAAVWPWLLLSLLVIGADQLTKLLVIQHFQLGDSQPVTSFFNLVRAHNPGAAFRFLADESGWQRWFFTAVGLAATALILWQLHANRGQRLLSLAMALILGGALGNVIDRLQHGHVIDFLDFHWDFLSPLFYGGHFPSFNVADSAITLGAICLILGEVLRMRRGKAS
jgi:signal peptidase II